MSFVKEFEHLKISLSDIKLATKDFSHRNSVAQGGFGDVYKGILSQSDHSTPIAVKRLDRSWGQGDHEFWTEVSLLTRYRHENVVQLIGFCDEGNEKALVYEYQSNGSLDKYLSDYTTLTWTRRLKICLGAANGLNFLQSGEGSQQRVLHRDLKSANILLDNNWNAKISDFGLSKIGPANQKITFMFSRYCGTPGYVDPLYLVNGFLSKESDVYSFGVVLFEVLCGRSGYFAPTEDEMIMDPNLKSLVQLAQLHYEQKTLEKIIDPKPKMQMTQDSFILFASIAYQCLKEVREERPTMSQIVESLEAALEIQVSFELL